MPKREYAHHATLYDFRDLDIMYKIDEAANGAGVDSRELAELLGFEAEEGGKNLGIRLAWMRRYGMVAFDEKERTWSLSPSGDRIARAHVRAPALRAIEKLPDEAFVEVMASVTSRFQRGEATLAHMLRREFLYGTKKR